MFIPGSGDLPSMMSNILSLTYDSGHYGGIAMILSHSSHYAAPEGMGNPAKIVIALKDMQDVAFFLLKTV